jgi:ribosome biogenesis GTPase A
MEKIQWFPGHMTKAMREMEAKKDLCDGIVCVLDARAPAATVNHNLLKMFGNKPVFYVLNKGDLADAEADNFVRMIEGKGHPCLRCNAMNGNSKRFLLAKMEAITKEKKAKATAKGINRVFRFMVIGIPNTGKSTLINLLSGEKKAKTGDKAGVTRETRWIRCGDFDLMDTPGTMPPSFEDQHLACHLAYIGSINDDILQLDDIALALLSELKENYPSALRERYALTDLGTPLELLEGVCKRMGFLMRGGDFDYDRAIKGVIDDFRKGKLGKISLEKAQDYSDLF